MFVSLLSQLARRVLPARHGVGWALAAAVGCLPCSAAAQTPLSVEVTPLRVELKMAAKATHTQAVSLRNDSRDAVHVRVRVDDYWLSLDGTPQFRIASPREPYSAAAWVRANPSDFTLKPGETATVRATTTVPAATQEGGYRCAIMFEFDPPGVDPRIARKDMQFRGRVATIVYATVGNPKSAIELDDLQVRQAPGSEQEVVAVLSNVGRGYVRTKGTMVISNAEGGSIREVPIPSVPVLPESKREVRIPMARPQDPALQPGRYKVEVRIDVGQPALLVGETTFEVARGR